MSNATVPAFETDLAELIANTLPEDFPAKRVSVGKEVPAGGDIGEEHTFIRFVDDDPYNYDASGGVHSFTCQVKHRVDRSKDPNGTTAEARMRRLYEALRFKGAFEGESEALYVDVVCRTFPRLLEEHYVVMDVTLDIDVTHA